MANFIVECQIHHSTGRRVLSGYRTSQQKTAADAGAYARYVWEGITKTWRHDTHMVTTVRGLNGRIVARWEWRRV